MSRSAVSDVTQDAAERFASDTTNHQLTIARDDGLYRHLRFRRMTEQEDGTLKPTSTYWFDLITWPGCLVINGDMHTYVFSRLEDMFEFFRGHSPNYGYWAEKIQAGPDVRQYSEDRLKQVVREAVEDDDEEEYPGLRAAVQDQVLDHGEIWDAASAAAVLTDFEFGATVAARCTCGAEQEGINPGDETRWEIGHRAIAPAGSGIHRVTWREIAGFRFSDVWEWDFTDWGYQFAWCCSAIPWGIAQYDAAKQGAS